VVLNTQKEPAVSRSTGITGAVLKRSAGGRRNAYGLSRRTRRPQRI